MKFLSSIITLFLLSFLASSCQEDKAKVYDKGEGFDYEIEEVADTKLTEKQSEMKQAFLQNRALIDSLPIEGKEQMIHYLDQKREHKLLRRQRGDKLFYESEKDIEMGKVLYAYWLGRRGFSFVRGEEYETRMSLFFKTNVKGFEKQKRDADFHLVGDSSLLLLLHDMGAMVDRVLPEGYETLFSESIFHLNAYVFNDRKESLWWLMKYDDEVVDKLVYTYGYDSDQVLNQAMLNRAYLNDKWIENLFARRLPNGSLEISEGMMKTASELSTTQKSQYVALMERYATWLLYDLRPEAKKYTQKERYEIVVYLGYYAHLAHQRNQISAFDKGWQEQSFLQRELPKNKIFADALKAADYYKIEGLKELVEGECICLECVYVVIEFQ